MSKLFTVVAVVALSLSLASAAAPDAKSSIGVFANYVMPTSDTKVDGIKSELKSAVGYGVGYRVMFTEKWDVGISAFYAKHDVKVEGTKTGTISWTPILVDLNYHLGTDGRFYVGPTVGYALWNDYKDNVLGKAKMKNQFVYGAEGGLDIPFAESFAFNASVRYLQAEAKGKEGGKISVNPVTLNVGVSVKF